MVTYCKGWSNIVKFGQNGEIWSNMLKFGQNGEIW